MYSGNYEVKKYFCCQHFTKCLVIFFVCFTSDLFFGNAFRLDPQIEVVWSARF